MSVWQGLLLDAVKQMEQVMVRSMRQEGSAYCIESIGLWLSEHWKCWHCWNTTNDEPARCQEIWSIQGFANHDPWIVSLAEHIVINVNKVSRYPRVLLSNKPQLHPCKVAFVDVSNFWQHLDDLLACTLAIELGDDKLDVVESLLSRVCGVGKHSTEVVIDSCKQAAVLHHACGIEWGSWHRLGAQSKKNAQVG